MSVREKPVASRFLDLKEKERSYQKHVSAVCRARATVNTTQPDTPRRLQVAAVNNAKYRKNLKRDFESNTKKVMEVEQRPYTTKQTRRLIPTAEIDRMMTQRTPTKPTRPPRDINIFTEDYETLTPPLQPMRGSSRRYLDTSSTELTPPSDASSSTVQTPYLTEVPKNKKSQIDTIKIGYSQNAIVESIEVDDETESSELNGTRPRSSRKETRDSGLVLDRKPNDDAEQDVSDS